MADYFDNEDMQIENEEDDENEYFGHKKEDYYVSDDSHVEDEYFEYKGIMKLSLKRDDNLKKSPNLSYLSHYFSGISSLNPIATSVNLNTSSFQKYIMNYPLKELFEYSKSLPNNSLIKNFAKGFFWTIKEYKMLKIIDINKLSSLNEINYLKIKLKNIRKYLFSLGNYIKQYSSAPKEHLGLILEEAIQNKKVLKDLKILDKLYLKKLLKNMDNQKLNINSSHITKNYIAQEIEKNLQQYKPDISSDKNSLEEDEIYKEAYKDIENQKQKRKKKEELKVENFKKEKEDLYKSVQRNINYNIIKSKGLTRKRPKEIKTPRLKHRRKYEKALKIRKWRVQEFKDRLIFIQVKLLESDRDL